MFFKYVLFSFCFQDPNYGESITAFSVLLIINDLVTSLRKLGTATAEDQPNFEQTQKLIRFSFFTHTVKILLIDNHYFDSSFLFQSEKT